MLLHDKRYHVTLCMSFVLPEYLQIRKKAILRLLAAEAESDLT